MAASRLLLALLCAFACCCCCCCCASRPALRSSLPMPTLLDCPKIPTVDTLNSAPRNSSTLYFVVPWKVGFPEYVVLTSNCTIDGFSVEVFRQALRRMLDPGPPSHQFVLYGNGMQTPSYDDMIHFVKNKTVDGVVADLTITSERMAQVGFTSPYLGSSLIMITPYRTEMKKTMWDFLGPFSKELWVTLLVCFVVTGLVLFCMEDKNPEFSIALKGGEHVESSQFRGPPIYDNASRLRRLFNAFWFTSLCIFQAQQESVRTHLGRIVTVMWLFSMVILNSSYTASLASFLSAPKGYPTIAGFQALLSDTSIAVGCLRGSFMKNYVQKLNLEKHKIVYYTSQEDYADALRSGEVKAVLDELPYLRLLLQSDKDVIQSSRPDDYLPSFGGFGYAFRKGDQRMEQLMANVSKMIVTMEEDGELQNLRTQYNVGNQVDDEGSEDATSSSLEFKSFGGLFIIVAAIYAICIIYRFCTRTAKSKRGAAIVSKLSELWSGCRHRSVVDRDRGDRSSSERTNGDDGNVDRGDQSLSESLNRENGDVGERSNRENHDESEAREVDHLSSSNRANL